MATKTAKKMTTGFDMNKGFSTIKDTTKNINEFALETSTEVVDAAINTAAMWQGVTEKALKGGFKLARKQQDITFDVLETVKTQFVDSSKRFTKLFSKN